MTTTTTKNIGNNRRYKTNLGNNIKTSTSLSGQDSKPQHEQKNAKHSKMVCTNSRKQLRK